MSEPELSYERAVELFDEKLRALEDGSLSLEDALRAVDEAGRYLRAAQARLDEARKRIEVRPPDAERGAAPDSRDDGTQEEVPF
jgi:exodeoxyribonuclease VII small subunit